MSEVSRVGPFKLGRTLGVGSTGKVKLATHKETGQKVAIKIVNKEMLSSRPALRKKVEREIAVLKLIDHPAVLRLFDVFETNHNLFLVLEHIEGGELFDYLVGKGRLMPQEALTFFQQIIAGLDYCHACLICHRDLKPENLLLDRDNRIKIADFGFASLMRDDDLLETSCGSPHYASPEVVQGLKYDGTQSDVWSCGVILYALLTGKLPFDDDNIPRLLAKVKAGKFSMPSYLPADVQDLIQRMITVDPEERITIPEIKRHPWFRSNRQPGDDDDDDPLHLGDDAHFDPGDPVDPEIMETLETLGWGEHDQLLEALHSDEYNLEKVFYRLLERRAAEKEAVLAELYPEEGGSPNRGGSGGAGGGGGSGDQSSGSPTGDSRYMQQRRSRGLTDGSADSSNNGGGGGAAAPAARNSSRNGSREGRAPGGAQRSSPLTVGASAASSSSSGVPSPSREGGSGGSPRYEKRRLSATAEQIAQASGSSTPVKKSWFSTMFDAKRKSSTKVSSSSSSTFGLHSDRTLEEILAELTRVFEALGIKWKLQGQFMIKAKYTTQQNQVVKFKIEIRDVEKQGHFINFSLRQGDLQTYRTLYDILQNELNI